MTPRTRQRLPGLVRGLVCIAAVSWLVVHTNWAELREVLRSADWRLFLLGVLSFGPAPVLLAIRLKVLLDVHAVHLSVWQAVKVTFAGNFIISALPVGTSGGDAFKAYAVARGTPHKHEAVTTVFFDRVIGVVGLVLMSGLMILINWGNPAFAQWGRVVAVLFVAFFGGAAVYFSGRMRRVLRLEWIVARLPLAGHLQRVDRAMLAFRHRKGRVLAAVAITLLLQTIAVVSHYLAGWALGMVGGSPLAAFPVYLAYIPICFLAGALPLGVMEETFNQLFVKGAGYGTREAAYSLSLLGRLIQLIWALPGGLAVLRGGEYRRVRELVESPEEAAAIATSSDDGQPSVPPL